MVVCKYFQQGYCRYGQSCRFEHIYGSKYTYHANTVANNTTTPSGITDEQLVNQVQTDVQAALKGGQWILSTYAPFKEKPAFPGITDLSPEEARLFIYEANANNTVDQAVAYINNLFKEAKLKHEQLLTPSPVIVKVLRSLYRGETVPSPFSNTPQGNTTFGNPTANAASSIFRSAVQTTPLFGQNTASSSSPSIFGQAQNNVFGTQSPDSAKSIFSQATQNVFGSSQPPNNVFGQSLNTTNAVAAKSIFAQANQNVFGSSQPAQSNQTNIFANAAQQVFRSSNEPFGQQQNSSPFVPQTQNSVGNVFQTNQSVFGSAPTNVFQQQPSDESAIYSKMEDLSPDDVEAFRSDEFKLGFIPDVPPPKALCI